MTQALATKLDEVEAEMKRIGFWHEDAPNLQAMVERGEIRSYLDAPSFELWLLALFLPSARRAVETGACPQTARLVSWRCGNTSTARASRRRID
jgi:uncharacterized protein YqcC (DUF446 family)